LGVNHHPAAFGLVNCSHYPALLGITGELSLWDRHLRSYSARPLAVSVSRSGSCNVVILRLDLSRGGSSVGGGAGRGLRSKLLLLFAT